MFNSLDNCSGVSYDWAKAVGKIKNSYALELRPIKGTPDHDYGFLLPEDSKFFNFKTAFNDIFLFKSVDI